VIGLSNPGLFAIGDTITNGESLQFAPMPAFSPEHFARLHNNKVEKYKQFNKGLEQLTDEGVLQTLYPLDAARREPILAVVGTLQFDVVMARLATEYNVETRVEPLPYAAARWVTGNPENIAGATWPSQALRTRDRHGNLVVLFSSTWEMNYCIEKNPRLTFQETGDAPSH
jgi:peptide chain release factor 3